MILCLCAFVGVVFGGAFLLVFKPDFKAGATILIDTRKYPETPQTDIAARTTYDSSAAIDTQVEILKSRMLARAVVDKLKLWQEPEFTAPRMGPRALISYALGVPKSAAPMTPEDARGRAVSYVLTHLIVKRVANAFTIDIAFESRYADVSAQVANAMAQAFIDWQRDLHRASLDSAGAWLEGRIKDLKEKSSTGQRSVAEYQAKNDIFSAGGTFSDERRLTELSDRLDAARAQVTDAQAKLNQLLQINADKNNPASDLEVISAIENASNEPSIATLRLQYLETSARYAQLSKLLPAQHQTLVAMRNQMQGLHATMIGELERVRLMLKNNLDTAQEKVKNLRGEISASINESRAAAAAQTALKQLEINAQTYQSVYDSFLHRYTEALESDRSPVAVASVISPAEPPSARDYKKALMIFAAFPVLGLMFGGGIAFLRERVSRPFWTNHEVERELKLPSCEIIPTLRVRDLKRAQKAFMRKMGSPPGESKIGPRAANNPFGCYALVEPLSRFAEGVRSIRVALKTNRLEKTRRAVGVTSALPNEGKSSVALALATSAASEGTRTVLVDCDFRNPALTKSWLGRARRVSPVAIQDGAALDDITLVDKDTGLHFIPADLLRGRRAVSELMGSDRLASLIADLKTKYDLVIVDLPPMSPIIDVAISQNFIDGYLLVIEWGETRVASVHFALRKMPQVYDNVIGVVLNKVNVKRLGKFGFHIRDYYSNRYTDRYIVSRAE